jgi:hypothetical protein
MDARLHARIQHQIGPSVEIDHDFSAIMVFVFTFVTQPRQPGSYLTTALLGVGSMYSMIPRFRNTLAGSILRMLQSLSRESSDRMFPAPGSSQADRVTLPPRRAAKLLYVGQEVVDRAAIGLGRLLAEVVHPRGRPSRCPQN